MEVGDGAVVALSAVVAFDGIAGQGDVVDHPSVLLHNSLAYVAVENSPLSLF